MGKIRGIYPLRLGKKKNAFQKQSLQSVAKVKCQFCLKESPLSQWIDNQCPYCNLVYDPILAQEGDD